MSRFSLGASCAIAALALLALAVSPTAAQSLPSDPATQELLRQQERDRAERQQRQGNPDVRLLRARPARAANDPKPERPCFAIHTVRLQELPATPSGPVGADERFAFARSALPPGPWSQPPAEPPCLGVRGINGALQAVQNAIVERGHVTTRVLAEPQDLSSGALVLTVVPGRIRAVRIEADGDDAPTRATVWNALPTDPGALLDLRDIEQGLENWKRLPTVEADVRISPGEQPGESDLLVRWRQARSWRASITADDAGSRATGKRQGSFTLSGDHWAQLNDLFYATLSRDLGGGDGQGTRGHSLHYSLPWGYLLVALNASGHRYHQTVAGATQTYLYSGRSRTADLTLSRLLHRDAVSKTTVSLRGWERASRNYIDDTEVEVQRRRTAGWELGVAHRRHLDTGTLDMNLQHRRGTGARGSLAAPEEAFGEGTSRARLTTADAQLALPLTWGDQRLRYGASVRVQWNHTPLVPQDRFAIGNRYTVRGFDGETTLAAERGGLLRNELGWVLGSIGAELYAGLDHGRVAGPFAERLLGTRLTGAVLGLRGSAWRMSYDVFVGAPVQKPEGYPTARTTAGFSLVANY